MNNFKRFSAFILILSAALTVFTSCDGNETETTTAQLETTQIVQTTNEPETVINKDGITLEIESQNNDYTFYKPQTTLKKENIDYTYNFAQLQDNENKNSANKETKKAENEYIYENIEEKENGISIMAKTSSAFIGNTATIMIQGEKGKQYTLEFYTAPNEKADYDGIGTKKADENGIVSWTFEIGDNCKKGNRKIYIKEKNSGNYAQTSINIQ